MLFLLGIKKKSLLPESWRQRSPSTRNHNTCPFTYAHVNNEATPHIHHPWTFQSELVNQIGSFVLWFANIFSDLGVIPCSISIVSASFRHCCVCWAERYSHYLFDALLSVLSHDMHMRCFGIGPGFYGAIWSEVYVSFIASESGIPFLCLRGEHNTS